VFVSQFVDNKFQTFILDPDSADLVDFVLMVEMGFFTLTGDRYQMTLPTELNMDGVKRAHVKLARKEDEDWIHPERLVVDMPRARAMEFQRLLGDMDQDQRLADRRALLFLDSQAKCNPTESRSRRAHQDVKLSATESTIGLQTQLEDRPKMAHEYLADLNAEQRHAVQHGIEAKSATTAPPLLVIAGAGSGKTKTLAHRVAHLVVNGVDPHRILLLTFTRRAAEEMIRRVKRITTTALGSAQVDLPWSGTFHAVGARYGNTRTKSASSRLSRFLTAPTPPT